MSLALLLEMAVSGLGDRVALGDGKDGLTYATIAHNAAGGAAIVTAQRPSHVVFIGRNGPAFPQLIFSAAIAGIPFVPMNYRLSDGALAELIDDLERPFVVVDAAYRGNVGEPELLMGTDEFLELAATAAPIESGHVAGDAPAILLYTSGTTSRPKAVALRHENLLAYILATVEFASATSEEAALVTVPPYHVAAVGSALSNFYAGRRVVYLPDFDAASWLAHVVDQGVTTAMLVPTMLSRIVEHLDGRRADVPTLRLLAYGGARMPGPVLERALAAFPEVGFCNAYGLTETSSTLALLDPQDHRDALTTDRPAVRARLGSVGRPVPGIEVEIRDEAGRVLAAGESGELYVRGAQVSGEYVGQPRALDDNGWFATRDRAWQDTDGYLFIDGRSDDTIIRGGENIAPAEVEEALFAHPAVRDAAVIGLPDEEWGQRLVAIIVKSPGAQVTEDELRDFVRGQLRGSRTPDEVIWIAALPHTPTGKLLRRELVEQFAGQER